MMCRAHKCGCVCAAKTDKGDKPSMMDILLNNVLKNIWIWGMAITYFFVYVIRQGVTSWSVFFLMNVKGVPDAATAGFMVSGLEIGGLAGSLLAGRLADGMVNSAKDPVKEGSVGKRVQVRSPTLMLAYRSGAKY
jgi:MFS transporter, OPA family, sugar phosphate sensor protein UhpC